MPNNPDHFDPRYDDGTEKYSKTVRDSYRKLQVRACVYEQGAPAQGHGVRLGVYQAMADFGPGASAKNVERLRKTAATAAKHGVQLLSFPELYIQGYTENPETARETAEPLDGPSLSACAAAAKEHGVGLIIGYGEEAVLAGGETHYFDSIAVFGQAGELLLNYRKTHLYAQQERDDWSFGEEEPQVFEINGFPVGILNCYENEFPELARILALKGAKLIVGPTAADRYYYLTSGERSSVPYPDVTRVVFPAFAYVNNLFYAYSNRCGYEERDGQQWHYRGNSLIIGPHGDIIVAAENERDTLLVSDCIPEYYGATHPEADYNYLHDRRPDLYGMLTAKTIPWKGGYTYPDYVDGKEIKK
jgi:predicted amidohydrolase